MPRDRHHRRGVQQVRHDARQHAGRRDRAGRRARRHRVRRMGGAGRGHEDRLPVGVEVLLHALHARTRDRARAADQRRRVEEPQARPAGDHQVGHLGGDVPLADHHEQAERRGAEGAAREAWRQDRAHAGRHPAGRCWKPGTRSPRTRPKRTRSSRRSTTSQRAYASQVVPARRFVIPPYAAGANYYWPEKK